MTQQVKKGLHKQFFDAGVRLSHSYFLTFAPVDFIYVEAI